MKKEKDIKQELEYRRKLCKDIEKDFYHCQGYIDALLWILGEEE